MEALGAVDIELTVGAARRSGRFWAWRSGSDSDDLACATLLAWWGAMSRKVDAEKVVNVRRYISRTARNLATHAIAGRPGPRTAGHTSDTRPGGKASARSGTPANRGGIRRDRDGYPGRPAGTAPPLPGLPPPPTDYPGRKPGAPGRPGRRGGTGRRKRVCAAYGGRRRAGGGSGAGQYGTARRQVWDAMADVSVGDWSSPPRSATSRRRPPQVVNAAGEVEPGGTPLDGRACTAEEAETLLAQFGAVDKDSHEPVDERVMLAEQGPRRSRPVEDSGGGDPALRHREPDRATS